MTPEKRAQFEAWVDWMLAQRLLVALGAKDIKKDEHSLTLKTKEGRWAYRPSGETWPEMYAYAVQHLLKES